MSICTIDLYSPQIHYVYVIYAVLGPFSHVQLFVTPMDCSPPGSSGHAILQARILELFAMPSSRGFEPAYLMFPALTGGFFITSTTWEAHVRHILLAYVTYYICCCFSLSVVSN